MPSYDEWERTDMMQTHYVIGLMSGTSLDGMDAALVKLTTNGHAYDLELVHFLSESYAPTIKNKLADLCIPETATIENMSAMNMYLGELFAEITLKLIREANFTVDDILLIGSHGQTIFHQPDPIYLHAKPITSTLQIGDIGVIAERTGITTIGDFRTRDMAAGGQGAPLVPYADYTLFKSDRVGRVLVNVGGIANLTILPKQADESDVIAYDTGPGNMLIDAFTSLATDGAQSYDENGALATQGTVSKTWLQKLLQHPYYNLRPPKSTGREMFGLQYAKKLWEQGDAYQLSPYDKIATITALTAQTIATEIKRYVVKFQLEEVLMSGGGSYNSTLMDHLATYLPKGMGLHTTDKYDMSPDAKEAIVFALLGYQCYNKQTNTLPSVTGAKNKVIMGKIAW